MWKTSSISLKKKENWYSGAYFIEVLHSVFPWQSKKFMNNIQYEIEVPFTKYRLTQAQELLMRLFSNNKKKKNTKVIPKWNTFIEESFSK